MSREILNVLVNDKYINIFNLLGNYWLILLVNKMNVACKYVG